MYIFNPNTCCSEPELLRLQKALTLDAARERRWRRIVRSLAAALALNLAIWILYFIYWYWNWH